MHHVLYTFLLHLKVLHSGSCIMAFIIFNCMYGINFRVATQVLEVKFSFWVATGLTG